MFDGSYPPGVTGKMIDGLDPVEPPRFCGNCVFYEEKACGCICGVLEAGYSEKELEAMTDEEYMRNFGKNPEDYCKDHEFWED